MTILCCLVSQQHVPNLLSVHHYRPDKLVLIESTYMERRHVAQNFLTTLHAAGLAYRIDENCTIQALGNASDFNAITMALKSAFATNPTAAWIANLTGGTKPMSIAAYEFFKAAGAKLIYIDAARPNKIVDVQSGKIDPVTYQLSISEFLLGYGFEQHKKDAKIQAAESRARKWWDAARLIADQCPDKNLLEIERPRWSKGRAKGLNIEKNEWALKNSSVQKALADTFGLVATSEGLVGALDKYAVQFLTGGWLEVFLWYLLDKHAQALGIWDVRLGIEPALRGSRTINEFDIAFMRNYELNMIECKSGAQGHDRNLNVLYKIEAVTRQFRALRVHSFLASTSSHLLDKDNNLKRSLADRAAIYRCRFVKRDDVKRLAQRPDDPALIRDVLYK